MNQMFGNQMNPQAGRGFNQGFQNQVSQAQLDRIHQNSLFGGQSQLDGGAQVQRIHQQTMQNGMMAQPQLNNQSFGGGQMGGMGMNAMMGGQGFQNQGFNQGFQNGVSQAQVDRIHQNSIFNGASQFDNGQVQRIHQATISGEEAGVLGGGMMGGQGFQNQGMNQGFQNNVSQAQVDRIHQNSLFNGGSQPDNAQVQRIHQATISGEEAGMLGAGMMGGMGMSAMMGGQGFQNQGYNQGFQNNVSQAQLDRIHQNSLYGGQSQLDGGAQVQRIHQQTMQNGMMAQPQLNNQSFGGGQMSSMGMNAMMGGQGFQNQGMNQGMNQGFQNSVSQAQLDRIHQNSLFGGQSQLDNAQAQRIHQATIQANSGMGMGGMMSAGMGSMGMGMGGNAFRAVMNADNGLRRDSEGPSSYPASMYTGSNQYDSVNQAVLNELTTNMSRNF